ncbi:MAG: imidazolonepropionase [Longimicrobiales bacterium]|nr:imidazolonepropionase [Longimicrobiales bacterium]
MSTAVPSAYGTVEDGVVAVRDGVIAWVGPEKDAPGSVTADPDRVVDLQGGWATPGLIDAHTHLVFGGNRADEFARRLAGATYEEIAREGGGILSTVRATRSADQEALQTSGRRRLATLVDHGVTTVEIKSGYGLDVATELRMLSVARALGEEAGVSVATTLLAAHALPPEFAGDREGYLELVCQELIPEAASTGLADMADAFCESIAFSVAECRRVLEAAAEHGLGLRLHADQLEDGGGAALAAEVGARSADHLEFASPEGVAAMAEAGTTAVLLPGAYHVLRQDTPPPLQALRDAGVPMAVATDLNPGTSPVVSPLVALGMGCTHFRLTPEEALAGMTRLAAPVLGLADRGCLEEGLRADIACWDVEDPAELAYWIGANPCRAVISGGSVLR